MLPKVILHSEVTVDGRMDWMLDDGFLYYRVMDRFPPHAMLSGSATMLAAFPTPDSEADLATSPLEKPEGLLPIVVVDSKGQIKSWRQILRAEYWGDAIVLVSAATPQAYRDELTAMGIETIVTGEDHVDLRAALEALNARHGIEVVRTDSGGVLNGVLLREGLISEVCVILNPSLAGGKTPRSLFVAPDLESRDGVIPLKLLEVETLDENFVWLRYKVLM